MSYVKQGDHVLYALQGLFGIVTRVRAPQGRERLHRVRVRWLTKNRAPLNLWSEKDRYQWIAVEQLEVRNECS